MTLGLASLLLAAASVVGCSPGKQPQAASTTAPATAGAAATVQWIGTRPDDSKLIAAVTDRVRGSYADPGGVTVSVSAADPDAMMLLVESETTRTQQDHPDLIFATRSGTGWVAVAPDSPGFCDVLRELPAEVVSDVGKAYFAC